MLNWSIAAGLLIFGSIGVELGPIETSYTVKRSVFVTNKVPDLLEFTVYKSRGFHPIRLELYDLQSKTVEPCTLHVRKQNKLVFSFTRPTRLNDQFRGTLWYSNSADGTNKRSVLFYHQVSDTKAAILISIVIDTNATATPGISPSLPASNTTEDGSLSEETDDDLERLKDLTCTHDCNEVDPSAEARFRDEVVDMALSMGNIQKPRLLLSGVKQLPLAKSLGAVDLIRQYIRCELHLPQLSYEILQAIYFGTDELLFEMTTMRATIEVLTKEKLLEHSNNVKIATTQDNFFDVAVFQRVGI